MTNRVVTYLSDEQYAAFRKEIERTNSDEASLLRAVLDYYWSYHDIGRWPDNDPERGGKREGAGRPPKVGGEN